MTNLRMNDEDGMTDATADEVEPEKKSGKMGLILGLILGLAGAGGGFYATVSGLLPFGGGKPVETEPAHAAPEPDALPDVAYVTLQPITISLERDGDLRHLRFAAKLEVPEQYASDVETITPRIVDVLNSYLRAVEISDLSDSLSLTRLRGHMLRRINIVAGEGRVRDVLIMEFVLN